MEISLELIGLIGVIVLVVIIMLIGSMKEAETNKKLSRYAQSIDNLSQQNHFLKKEILALAKNKEQFIDEMEDELNRKIKEQVKQNVYPILNSMREIESVMQSFQEEQSQRIDQIENTRRKEINYSPKNQTMSNEKLIITQYSQGKSEALIAKDLRIGIGEVDLVLKLANLKK